MIQYICLANTAEEKEGNNQAFNKQKYLEGIV